MPFAKSMMRSKKLRSTIWVVGLCGKDRINIFGFGQVRDIACSRFWKKSVSAVSGTLRRSPPAMITEYRWIG